MNLIAAFCSFAKAPKISKYCCREKAIIVKYYERVCVPGLAVPRVNHISSV